MIPENELLSNAKNVYLIKIGFYVLADEMPDTDGLFEVAMAWARDKGLDPKRADDIPSIHPNFAEDGVSVELEEEGGFEGITPLTPNTN